MPDLRAAYGPLSERFSRGYAPDEPLVVLEHAGAAEALREIVARRFRGETVFVRAMLQRENSSRVDSVAPSVLATFEALDDRRVALDQACAGTLQANGRNLSTIPAYNGANLRLMQAALRLADGLVVSSQAERRRIEEVLDTQPPYIVAPRVDPSVPQPGSAAAGEGDAVVIWAPHLSGDVASAFAVALSEFRLPLLLVSASAPTKVSPAQWFAFEQGALALSRARLIVDANAYGADAALALAAWPAALLVDRESGADELLEHVRTYDRGRMASLFESAVGALGEAPARRRSGTNGSALGLHEDRMLDEGPLATIVIPTLDRPVLLRYALESCRRQTYRNVETIVVVDGGPRLPSLEAEFPEVRFLYMPENDPVASTNAAYALAEGEYVTLLSDDDLFFPDHVAALVTALERSGAAVAHADVLTAFLRGDDREWLAYGLESNMSRAVDPSSLLVANRIGATSAMIRRSCLSAAPFDASIPLYRDFALWLGLSAAHDFVHVERITSCYTIRNQGAGQQSTMWHDQAVAAYEAIYQRYPVSERPMVQQQRAQMLAFVRAGGTALAGEPAMQIAPVKWPPF